MRESSSTATKFLTWHGIATCKGVARKTATTLTKWTMITHTALGINAAGARARILTTLTYACFISGTFGTQYTLGSTVGWKTDVQFKTGANCLAVKLAALGIGATR